ncbi:hypothetical protein L204_101908 [Cryptococcus depauperatus]|nr:hypothetical protein L204_05558 [Cryptococcus depauperatus CBS 7855]
MSLNHHLPKKVDLTPKKHHGFLFVLLILGFLLPPLAVAARFGIGSDFFTNVFLCICGYIPCHFHNFYIQNIRNNQNRARTPKWAIRYGLVDNSANERHARKNQWAKRFDERNNHSTLTEQELEAGEEGPNYVPRFESPEEVQRRRNEGLWSAEDEEYYNADQASAPKKSTWHYPMNFEGTVGDGKSYTSKNSTKRPHRSRASSRSSITYPPAAATDDVPEWGKDYGSKGRSNKTRKGLFNNKQNYTQDLPNNPEYEQTNENRSGSNGQRQNENGQVNKSSGRGTGDPNWNHQF